MKLIYKGKYNGDPTSLPRREHFQGAVKFKEFDDPKQLGKFMNRIAVFIMVIGLVSFWFRAGIGAFSILGGLCAIFVVPFPHELLHAICFKKEVYLYTNLKDGMLFVVGPETMSKSRFIIMSLLPNVVIGFIPYIICLINPNYSFLGTLGFLAIGMGTGDYYNVYNAMTQMPKGARTYLYQFNSYWYVPEK